MKVGFIGLGRMGAFMAANIQKAGHQLVIHDIRREAGANRLAAGAICADSPKAVAEQSEVIFTSLPGPKEVEPVVFGPEGILAGVRAGAAYFDLSTNSQALVKRFAAALAEKGAYGFDAPVSGGPKGAESGKLAIWVGGDRAVFDTYKPVLDAFGDQAAYIGPIGSATVAKLVHNMAGYAIQTAMAEVFSMGVKAGMDPLDLWKAIRQGSLGRRRTFDRVTDQFLVDKYDPPAFSLKLAHKDVSLAVQMGRDLGVPMRFCISCNVCFERLTLERDVACVTNPMLGTEFEAPEFSEPPLPPAPQRQRILVLGAGVGGMEVARLAAARGHEVEVWEKAAEPGGQIHLAVAAPDKEEVRPLWTWRWDQAIAAGVTVRCGVAATPEMIRAFAPDHVVLATGARPRPLALQGASPLQAWDVMLDPALVPEGSVVAVIGGGIVGLEVAEILALRRCRITVLEALPAIAPAMARNNRTDIMIRLLEAGVVFHTRARVECLADGALHFAVDGAAQRLDGVTHVIAAVGALPNRDALPIVEATGLPHTLVGDANQPGDCLSVLRDA